MILTSIFTAIGTAIGTALGFAVGTSALAVTIGATIAIGNALIFGGIAISASLISSSMAKGDYGSSSATYGNPVLQTQTNPDLPVPLLYGTVKLAGNRIWQDDKTDKGIRRIVAFAEGEITDFTDIRLNDIKIEKIKNAKVQKFYGTNNQSLPSGIDNKTVGSLKNIAYLYITVPVSQDINANYNLTAIVKGRKIRVYTTPNNYTVKYSENPAWVLFDFLTSYNGRGLCLNDDGTLNNSKVAELFDLDTFIEAAAFCDEQVLTNGEITPRFTFNMIFDSQTSHRTLLDEIYRSCRGVLCVKNGKFQFKIDKAEVTKKVFKEQDIINGSEVFQTLPYEEHYDILKIDYVSPKHEWQKVQAYAELPTYRDGVPIEHNVNCYSVTNFQQASRLAWYYINSKVLCPYFGSFQTGFKASDLEVGDVIEIPVMLMGLTNYLVKVTSVIDNGTGVYTVHYRTYDARLYSDSLGSDEPLVLISNLSDIATYPADVQNFNVVQQDQYYSFTWFKTSDDDVYEIRYGQSWEAGEVIGKNIAINSYQYKIRSRGLKTFWIKAKNSYNYSRNATMDVINISDIPETNVIVTYDLLANNHNVLEYLTFYNHCLKLAANVDRIDGNYIEETLDFNDLTETLDLNDITLTYWENIEDKWNEGNQYYKTGGYWGIAGTSSGQCITPTYNLGGDTLTCYVSLEQNVITSDQEASAILYWRYHNGTSGWSNWEEFRAGQYTINMTEFKLVFSNPNNNQVACNLCKVVIDVPDKFETKEVNVTSTAGLYVDYDFNAIPSIVATVNDNITAYAVVESKTKTQALIKVYNNSGQATTGNVSLYLKGY